MSNKEAMLKKFQGDEGKYKEYLRSLGSKGGKKSKPPIDHPTRFDNNRELAVKAGKIGGKARQKALANPSGKRKI